MRCFGKVEITTGGHRSYKLNADFSGNMTLMPMLNGVHADFSMANDHDRKSLISMLESLISELKTLGEVGKAG